MAKPRHDAGGAGLLCPLTGVLLEERSALRLVVSPEGRVVPDLIGTLPGVAAWVQCSAAALGLARESGALDAAFGCAASLPESLESVVERAVLRRIQECIALSRRGGNAVCGFAKVEAWLARGGVTLRLEAGDAGKTGEERLARRAPAVPVSRALTRQELGIPFGRAACVHVALGDPALSAEILKETHRLSGFRKTNAL
jgi:predicted RNA-binding protein YlxR (DUF448 family)